MALQADLHAHLDIGGPVGTLLGVLTGSAGGIGAIVPALDPGARDDAAGATAGISLAGVGTAAEGLAGALQPLLGRLPVAGTMLPAVENAIVLLERAATPDLPQRIEALIGGLDDTLQAERGGALGLVLRILEALRQAPETDLLRQLATQIEHLVTGGAPLSDSAFAGFGEIIPAITGAVGALGALARLDATLEEAERLAGLAALQLDRAGLAGMEAEITARLGSGAGSLAAFVGALDLDDAAAVATAAREIEAVSLRLGALSTTLRDGMAFGEATLVHLDLASLRAVVDTIRGEVRGADLAPLERAIAAIAGRLSGVFSLDLTGAPVRSLDELLQEVEGQLDALVARIGSFDVAQLLGPLADGLGRVTGLPGRLAAGLEAAAAAIGSALDEIRDAVRALPLDDVASRLREVAAAIARAIETLTRILGGIEDAIRTASTAAQTVLAAAETGLDDFKTAVDGAFAGARGVVEAADIDGLTAEVEANIRGFLDVVAKADLTPFFNTATEGIGTAASIVEKVPFDLLPDSMEQEVVDAIRPVKQVDADATRLQIEATLEIRDGKFNLRPVITAAVADLKAQLDALRAGVGALDPEQLARPLQAPLDDFKAKVEGLRPSLELAPVRAALDAAKDAVAGIDPAALLRPADQAFDELLAGIDRFSPAQLVAPLDERLDAAREKLLDLVKLREWRDRLDAIEAQAVDMIGLLDIGRLEKDITLALRAFQAQLADEPRLGLIDTLLAMLGPLLGGAAPGDAFGRVAAWLGDGAGAAAGLGDRARAIRDGIDATAADVTASEPAALSVRLSQPLAELGLAITAHPAGPARLQLEAALAVDVPLAELAAMQPPWRRYRDALEAARQATRDLGAEGFSEADATARRLAAAVAPLAPLGRIARDMLRPVGLSRLDRGLAGLFEEIFETASPKRLAKLATPLVAALRGRLQAVLEAVTGPFRTAIADLLHVVELFDLSPLREHLQGITDALKAEISGFKPSTLLAEPLSALNDAKAAIAAFDPLAAVTAALDALKARIVAILGKLDLGKLLEQPIRLFAAILDALSQLDVDRLLGPILDRLDAIAAQVDSGLESTFGAFKRLQDALPDHVGGTTVGASASVSVG